MKRFKLGDVVKLKAGSGKMTINGAISDGKCECIWFEEGKLCNGSFTAKALEKVKSK